MADDPESEDGPRNPFQGFRLEVDPERVQETIRELRQRVSDSFHASRYTKIRLSFRGRQLGPDLPLAIFLVGEGAAFWLLSPLPALLINLGARAVLDVEFIHEADELVQQGLQFYLDGEVEQAERAYRKALRKRPDDPAALYNLGTLLRVAGRSDEARAVLRQAAMGAENHPDVKRASEALGRMDS